MDNVEITVGADPELFIKKGIGYRGTLIPSTGIIGGTKKEPIPIPGMGAGFTMQEDNVMCEFNIPPAKTAQEFDHSLSLAMQHIDHILPHGHKLIVQPAGIFNKKYLKSKQATTFGCDPDYNAWRMAPNTFIPASNPQLRCCGGHVHVGLPANRKGLMDCTNVIRAMDLFLGVPSIILDEDKMRKEMYGKAGAHRGKPYGVEYRVLSNFWLATGELRKWVFNATQRAVNFAFSEEGEGKLSQFRKEIVESINDQDAHRAEKLIHQFELVVP